MKTLSRLFLLASIALPLLCRADAIYTVSLDTSSVAGSTYTLVLQFNDGSGSLDANNTATIRGISFGAGGSAGTNLSLYGGAAGDASAGFSLADSDFFNAAYQDFVAGSMLQFTVTLTGNADSVGIDEFAFGLDGVNTTDFGGSFFYVDVGGAPQVFAADGNGTALDGVQASYTSPVPEPATFMLISAGMALIAPLARKHMRK